jgi:hypothetical protein
MPAKFAKYGNPNGSGDSPCPQLTASSPTLLAEDISLRPYFGPASAPTASVEIPQSSGERPLLQLAPLCREKGPQLR